MSDPRQFRKRLDALGHPSLPRRNVSGPDFESLKRRLIARPRRAGLDREPAEAIIYHRDIPYQQPRHARPHAPVGTPVGLEDAVPGSEIISPAGGKAYSIEVSLNDLEQEEWKVLCAAFRNSLTRATSRLRQRLSNRCYAGPLTAEDVIFLDLETTGLSCTPVFLVGTMVWERGGFAVRQYLARNYAEEPAIISLSLADAARRKLLVSFNGKSFDVPYLRTRAAANGIPFTMEPAHFDLLHECRRTWRHVLPDCRLQTLESRICRRPRYDDIPSCEIPEAYHAFVRTGNAAAIAQILKHNMLDLITLADLMTRLPASS